MKLLNVEAVLDRDKGTHPTGRKTEILRELDDKTTSYAILSHRWGTEVSYEEITGLLKMAEEDREEIRQRYGYQKIIKSCELAMKDGYEWVWIDTCCIDKRSSSELSEAINSMYQWYQNAQVCYAYLNDVDASVFPTELNSKFSKSNGWPEWFVRGWTLQELIAPKRVEFFNKDWEPIGNKRYLAPTLGIITGIPREVLTGGLAAKRVSVAQIMSWASNRKTTRVEDRAYSLMGLFGVNMPMLYGEGKKAFRRLQLEIIRESSDHSIFAWSSRRPGGVLAEGPDDFGHCRNLRKLEPDEFVETLIREYIDQNNLSSRQRRIDILGSNRHAHQRKLAALRDAVNSQQFRTFTVSNAGIQVFLPVVPSREFPSHLRAILACTSDFGLDVIDLVPSGSCFGRTIGAKDPPSAYPELKTLYLTHHQDANETLREFTLDDMNASYCGFTRRGTHPREFTVYANDGHRCRFAVGLGYYLGQGWVHIVYDDCSTSREVNTQWSDFASATYNRMWRARAEHARNLPKHKYDYGCRHDHFIKHAHLPRSIWAARVIWGRWEMDNLKVVIDIDQCPGCCDGPHGWTVTRNDCGGLETPGLMNVARQLYKLNLDGWPAPLHECSSPGIVLGDYGDYSNGDFERSGNIFEDMRTLDIDSRDPAYRPVVSHVSGYESTWESTDNQDDLAVAFCDTDKHLALRRPKGFWLPANEDFALLLKTLSIRLTGKYLVITIIQCSDFYRVDDDGEQSDSGDDPVSDCSSHSREPEILTPLCTIASPQVWRRELPCMQRREQFRRIREHFYALVNMCHKIANGRKRGGTIKSFSDLFGLKYLRNYVGKITFFERLPTMMETDSLSSPPIATAGALEDGLLARRPRLSSVNWAMTSSLFRRSPRSKAAHDLRLEVVLPLLRRRCQNFCAKEDVQHRYGGELQKVVSEFKFISCSLSVGLLDHIKNTFVNTYCEHEGIPVTGRLRGSYLDYDRSVPHLLRLSIPCP
ncbi:hypothetical protein EDC04DRAFT_1056984 [Pisolithus marmoratus]|nr:hypothetical protein EDC04DRAFT_1056984 [Pisolithus marmoratus]